MKSWSRSKERKAYNYMSKAASNEMKLYLKTGDEKAYQRQMKLVEAQNRILKNFK